MSEEKAEKREKAKRLIEQALDDGVEVEERNAFALRAIKIVRKYKLLDLAPLDGILENETVKAVKTVADKFADPEAHGRSQDAVQGGDGGAGRGESEAEAMTEKYEVTEVEPTGAGWWLTFRHPKGPKGTEVPRTVCDVPPQVGEEVIFGEGEERRSVTVGGRLYLSAWPPELA